MPQKNGYQAPSVGRALRILDSAASSYQGLGISQLARRLGISKGTVSGLCAQLCQGGALVRDPVSKRYVLGPFIAGLAGRGFWAKNLKKAAGPELERICWELKESIFVGVMAGNNVSVVDARQPSDRVGVSAGPGTRLPLTFGAVGKVLLAGLPPRRVDELLRHGLKAHTPKTVTNPDAFRQDLEKARSQGYALEEEEYLSGVWGVAAPLDSRGGAPAAIWAVGFVSALGPGFLEQAASTLVETAGRIRAALKDLEGFAGA